MALPRKHRLSGKKEFEKVFKKGKTINSETLRIKFIPNHLSFSRFGIIVPLLVSKKATIRNKTKRRLGEAIRLNIGGIKTAYDVVIIVKPEILRKGRNETRKEILTGLIKIN